MPSRESGSGGPCSSVTLKGLFTFGAIGLIVGPLLGAFLMAAWTLYRRVFRTELGVDTDGELAPAGDVAHREKADAAKSPTPEVQ